MLQTYQYVYILGIGGIGMSALAMWFHQAGKHVFGHDSTATELTGQLIQQGIPIHYEIGISAIPTTVMENPGTTLVLYSPSISTQNVIFQYLSNHGYLLVKRGAVFNMITQHKFTIAVAGTHGKTTSTALMAHILYQANKPITAFLGGIAKNYNTNFITNSQELATASVIIEADEFDRFFLCLHPNIALITTVDPDHLDIYGSAAGFEEGFHQFLNLLPIGGYAILHKKVANQLSVSSFLQERTLLTYALDDAPIHAANIIISPTGQYCFDYVSPTEVIKNISLTIPGYHNIENALGVITACLCMGVNPMVIRQTIQHFKGVKRRYDVILQSPKVIFIDDYGHHPIEIVTLLNTLRALYPKKKITVIFRPNQYSRTKDFLSEIAASLSLANHVLLLDIYSDREVPIAGITSESILEKITSSCKHLCTASNLLVYLDKITPLEVVVNLGAGDADRFIIPIKNYLLKKI